MKITFPRKKETIKMINDQVIYVVICQFMDSDWGIADFWRLPYAASRYLEAIKLRNAIQTEADTLLGRKEHFVIAKITL